ncbi:MAG: ABC transporter ATP-binding protein [Flavobacteriales bacterium]|nr:MAG: ABC transporter ATP-binding protein [Flavobacteriales bacterium]
MIVSGEGLTKSYGGKTVVNHVTIRCKSGTITGLLGTNGAGKSTLFKMLLGLVKPDKGHVKIGSTRKKPLGGIIEKPCLYGYLNAAENLKIFASIQKAAYSHEEINRLLKKVGLPTNRKDPVKNFSMGMKQRIGVAIALINEPEALVLDEPFSGLDPIGVNSLRSLILHLAHKEGIAVLIASHNVEELSKFCDFLYVIKDGEIVRSDTAKTLITQYTDRYLIVGENLNFSGTLKPFNPVHIGNGAEIRCDPTEITKVLRQLVAEEGTIISCIPKINMNRLFQYSEL